MFYTYRQNNSGGVYDVDSNVASVVILEADSAFEADSRAQDIGIYFDDDYNIDCDCCGQRWYSQANGWGDEGSETLEVYGDPLVEVGDDLVYYTERPFYGWTDPYGYVHYKDGSKKVIREIVRNPDGSLELDDPNVLDGEIVDLGEVEAPKLKELTQD